MSEAAPPPKPVAVAQLEATDADGSVSLTLTAHEALTGTLADGFGHVDKVSTALKPTIEKGAGKVLWLQGHRLSAHDAPGDTVVTYTLLLQLDPIKAVWHEDHKEVPTLLYAGGGTLKGRELSLELKDSETSRPLKVTGLLNR